MAKPEIIAYEFGSFRLNVAERRLLRDDKAVLLTPKLFDILLLLVRERGAVVTKDTLMKEIWPGTFVEENNLTVSVSALRKALGERPREPEYIETVAKRGYRFVARVRDIWDDSAAKAGARFIRAGSKMVMDEHERGVRALAVLPLVNVDNDPYLEYLSDGITESIISSLSCLPQLRVMARSTVFHYKGREPDARQIGRELNVSAVLAGRLRRLGEHLILGVELVNVGDGSQLWGEQYNRSLSDIFNVQEEIAREISETLRFKLTGEEREQLAKRYTENTEAYQLYLKGRYFWNKRTVNSINRGIKFFNEAISLDPNYAQAYVGLADCYISLAGNMLPTSEGIQAARRAIVRALESDEALAEARVSLAFIETIAWNWPEAEKQFRRAIELSPSSALAHGRYSIYLAVSGRMVQAISEAQQALNTDPLSAPMRVNAARIFYYACQYERSMEQCREALEIESHFGAAHTILGLIYGTMGMYKEAIAETQQAVSLMDDDPEVVGLLGYLYAASGRRREARKVLAKLQKLSEQKYVPPTSMVWIYIGLREKEKSFEWLEKAYEERSYMLIHLTAIPVFNYLRADPRFDDLLRRIGLPT